MTHGPYHTNSYLWALCFVGLFVAFGFVDLREVAGKGGGCTWRVLTEEIQRGYPQHEVELIVFVLVFGLVLAVPSVILGWVMQALLVVGWRAMSNSLEPQSVDIGD